MKITRRQLRLIIENTMEDTLAQLEKVAKPAIDKILTSRDLSVLEDVINKAVNSADKNSVLAKISELYDKEVFSGRDPDRIDSQPLSKHLIELFSAELAGRWTLPKICMHPPAKGFFGHLNNINDDSELDLTKYFEQRDGLYQGRAYVLVKEPKEDHKKQFIEDLEKLASKQFPNCFSLYEFSK